MISKRTISQGMDWSVLLMWAFLFVATKRSGVTVVAQAQPNFQAAYQAQFQHLVDPECSGPPPVVRVACRGTPTIVSTSHSTISCSTTPQPDGTFEYLECTNSCATVEECRAVYLAMDVAAEQGPFGTIDFTCSGDTIDDVDAFMSYQGDTEGRCNASILGTRNFHIARLGVQCGGAYDFDDYFFECNGLSDVEFFGEGFGDVYSCLNGENCQNNACSVNFDNVEIRADLDRFQQQCVTTSNNQDIPVPPERTLPPAESMDLQTRFSAVWGSTTSGSGVESCSTTARRVQIECTNGVVDSVSTFSRSTCTQSGLNVLDCTDTVREVNTFTGVEFNCTGFGQAPEVIVTYQSNQAFCTSNPNPLIVYNAVQLGLQCDFASGTGFGYNDVLVECGGSSALFDELNDINPQRTRWTCAEGASFDADSSASNLMTIRDVSIRTDEFWHTQPFRECYTLVDLPENVTRSPTQAPVAVSQTPAPVPATRSPTNDAPSAPISTRAPNSTTPTTGSSGDDDGINVGIIAGIAGGGALVIAIAAVFYFRLRNGEAAKESSKESKTVAQVFNNGATSEYQSGAHHLNYDPSPQGVPYYAANLRPRGEYAGNGLDDSADNRPSAVSGPYYVPRELQQQQTTASPRSSQPQSRPLRNKDQCMDVSASEVIEGKEVPGYDDELTPPPRSSQSHSSSGHSRSLRNKDQCMSVAVGEVVEGVEVPDHEDDVQSRRSAPSGHSPKSEDNKHSLYDC